MFSSNMDSGFFFNNLRLVELPRRELYGAESLEVNRDELNGLKRFRSCSNHEGHIRAIF